MNSVTAVSTLLLVLILRLLELSTFHACVHDHADEAADEGLEVLHLRLGGQQNLQSVARALLVVVEELQQRSAERAQVVF